MPRVARKKSESNIYHIMLRGINRQQVFIDDEDYQRFLDVLEVCREISGFRLHAYCLMRNHIHMLLQTIEEPLEQVMKRIGTRYVVWYNNKYSRTGHLFQDRYKSEPVEDDVYFLTALRYILNNPVKAGICEKPEEYPYSSASDYFAGGGITDTAFAEEMSGRDALLEYLRQPSDDVCMDDEPPRVNDKTAIKMICEITEKTDSAVALREIHDHSEQYIRRLRQAGLSIRQISRLTGLSIGVVRSR